MGEGFARAARAGLWAAESWTLPRRGRTLSALPLDQREARGSWPGRSSSRHARLLLRAIVTPIKSAHFDHPTVYQHAGCRHGREVPLKVEPERWLAQVTNGREVEEDLELECEVVVVGTGAGGAAAAYELASPRPRRADARGGRLPPALELQRRAAAAYKQLYRDSAIDRSRSATSASRCGPAAPSAAAR